MPEINKNEIPFEVPESWVWTRLGEVCEVIMEQSPRGQDVVDSKIENSIEFHQGKLFFGNKYLNNSNKYTINGKKFSKKKIQYYFQ